MKNPHKSKNGLSRIGRALGYSMQGLATAVKQEAAFRQELMLCVVLLPMAIFLPLTVVERVLLIGVLLAVLVVELLNSALETVVDRISLDNHELSKRAKDLGSAAVFLALVAAAVTWGVIALPVLYRILNGFLLEFILRNGTP